MLKLIVKLVFGIFALLILVVIVKDSEFSEPKNMLSLILGFGVLIYTVIDLREFLNKRKEDTKTQKFVDEKRMRDIEFNFKRNYFENLKKAGIFSEPSQINTELLYTTSKDETTLTILNKSELYIVVDELEEFSTLHEKYK